MMDNDSSKRARVETTVNILTLSDDVLERTCEFLTADSIGRMARVCKSFEQFVRPAHAMWRCAALQDWGFGVPVESLEL
jgi:hypothetical protein